MKFYPLWVTAPLVLLMAVAATSAGAAEKTTRKKCLDHFEAWKAVPPGPSQERAELFAALEVCYENEAFTEEDLQRMYNDM